MSEALRQSYDAVPYRSSAFRDSHPDRLATLGWLLGMKPARVDRCRVLEIGCASGGNLVPMAASLPGSEFVGIDLSPVQIEKGAADVAALKLANIRLLALDILDFPEDLGKFDYVIAHGVYSWVPEAVRDRLLAICARQLSPAGIAYVSYNVLPGWRLRGIVRDAMVLHTRGIPDPRERVAEARAVVEFLAESVPGDAPLYRNALRTEVEALRNQDDTYVLHEFLEAFNEPVYFSQFVEHAARHGLAYLVDTDITTMGSGDLDAQARRKLEHFAPNVLLREQFLDFVRARTFRRSLLVHEGVAVTREVPPSRVMALRITSSARPQRENPDIASGAPEAFRTLGDRAFQTSSRIGKAAMLVLGRHWPLALAFDDLYGRARTLLASLGAPVGDERGELAAEVLRHFGAGVIELHSAPSPFVIDPGDRPEVSALVRLQLQRGLEVTDLRHGRCTSGEEARRLLLLLDGARSRREVAATFWPGVPLPESMRRLDAELGRLARLALFVR